MSKLGIRLDINKLRHVRTVIYRPADKTLAFLLDANCVDDRGGNRMTIGSYGDDDRVGDFTEGSCIFVVRIIEAITGSDFDLIAVSATEERYRRVDS